MQISTQFVDVPGVGRPMRTFVAAPTGNGPFPGIVFYSDIFQLTACTLRWVSRLASYGFVVAAPEIYYRIEEPGTVLAFDDAGKARGQADVESLTTRQFDADIAALLDWLEEQPLVVPALLGAAGHCTGGHLAVRAALDPRVLATVAWYPTGLADGVLGADDSHTLARMAEIRGALALIFGSRDPHTSAEARELLRNSLTRTDVDVTWAEFDAEHAFARDVGPRYDAEVTDRAFGITTGIYRAAFDSSALA
ncbi:MAG: dienelactone hydrolase family protein [Actinobacteria bacterium]|nr:dienelactone hydrolase family protein [Actinomycetota bacterium]